MSKRIAIILKECVACGCCVKSCPTQAIAVPDGICALVDEKKCVGCGKCALSCPAEVIQIIAREEAHSNG